jgi:hypothetical protein
MRIMSNTDHIIEFYFYGSDENRDIIDFVEMWIAHFFK